jgi:hypothetical protein
LFQPAPHYAALFEQGRRWTYVVDSSSSYWDDSDPAADADGVITSSDTSRVTCAVAAVGRIDGGVWSLIECDGMIGTNDPVSGTWVADGRGLYRTAAAPASAAELEADQLVIAAAPAESHRDVVEDVWGEGPESVGEHAVIRDGERWCVSASYHVGDASWTRTCFAGGIVEGDFGWSGGSDNETAFRLES